MYADLYQHVRIHIFIERQREVERDRETQREREREANSWKPSQGCPSSDPGMLGDEGSGLPLRGLCT